MGGRQIRENRIRLWFAMWLQRRDLGIAELFTDDAVYVESWGPEYHGAAAIKHWFEEWNTRGQVLRWDIQEFFHKQGQTLVTWYFENAMNDGTVEAFDGVTLVRWTDDDRIRFLQEFGCNLQRYDPYQDGPLPKFREESPKWF